MRNEFTLWLILFLIVLSISPARSSRLNEKETVLRAGQSMDGFKLDGHLNESCWTQTDSISNLTMIEPFEAATPTYRTVVKILANSNDLIFGIRCEDSEPDKIVAYSKKRDARLRSEDHIKLVLDTFLDGRSGYVFAVNPNGARYDALISEQHGGENQDWDTIWEAKTSINEHGWSAEIKIPIKSLSFGKDLTRWGLNIERRIQRLQETDRWAGAKRDYRVTQTSQAGQLVGLPKFNLGIGLNLIPSLVVGAGVPEPNASTEFTRDLSLDIYQKLSSNLQASLTINTDFAETEVDARRTNITRFPLFFPEKRTFFLEGADIFEFGLGLSGDVIPYFSRRIGLLEGQQIPIKVGGKLQGRIGNTNLGALAVHTDKLDGLTSGATLGVIRVKQNVLTESSIGMIATIGDPTTGNTDNWLAGVDLTYKTSHFFGNKNFWVGIWGLQNNNPDLSGDQRAAGFKIDYPNNLFDISFTYKYIGDAFEPSLGFVPRKGIKSWRFGFEYSPHPSWKWVRQMFHEFYPMLVTNLNNEWESYRVFMAPINWRLESGDRFEFNVVPQGENLPEPFEISDGVTIPTGKYHWMRYRLEGGLAAKRKISGQLTWWFGEFYSGKLDQIELTAAVNPSAMFSLDFVGEINYGQLEQGNFTQRVLACRVYVNFSPDMQLSSFIQYDNESQTFGMNTRFRWTFNPLGDLFIVYNHNLIKDITDRWSRDSNQLLIKLRYGIRI